MHGDLRPNTSAFISPAFSLDLKNLEIIPGKHPGESARYTFKFKALKAGTGQVNLIELRPWPQGEVATVDTYDIIIH